MIIIKTISRFKNYLYDENYFIALYTNKIYIMNYEKILQFKNNHIEIKIDNFTLKLEGMNFFMNRKTKEEIEISGQVNKVEYLYV